MWLCYALGVTMAGFGMHVTKCYHTYSQRLCASCAYRLWWPHHLIHHRIP